MANSRYTSEYTGKQIDEGIGWSRTCKENADASALAAEAVEEDRIKAETARTGAESAKTAAEAAQVAAAASQTASKGSADAAAASATSAAAQNTSAASQATAASQYASAAQLSANTATSEAETAGEAASAAFVSKTAAETAQEETETARDEAVAAADEVSTNEAFILDYKKNVEEILASKDITPVSIAIDDSVIPLSVQKGTSWYNETLNTETRGARREFPSVRVVVAETDKVTIFDGDDPSLPMWMVFNGVAIML
jgi:hypothetical protein